MKNILALFLLASAVTWCGCVAPSKEKWASADCGLPPLDTAALVRNWMRDTLVDPQSVQDLEISEPERGALQRGLVHGGGYVFGWRSWVTFNAKNRMGGYVGRTTHVFLFRNGAIVATEKTGTRTLPDMWY